ncbi:MAG: hypothetical protein AB7I30_20575 [Isosphaeraceae bacterium]
MPRAPFPGYPIYLEAAAREIGHPEAEVPARRIATLSALANLCAQASLADRRDAPAILAKASEFRDQLHAAALAADLMLAEATRSLGGIEPEVPTSRTTSASRKRRVGPAKSSENSV